MAHEALQRFPECFWFRSPNAPLDQIAQVELIVRRMRQHGNRSAWEMAYQIEQCL